MQNLPKISVITVVYNSVDSVEKTIRSVLSQSYRNFEYIIIDGGSTDGTVDVINKYISSINIFISEKDEGIYDAMNKGIKLSSGDFVGLINSGDVYCLDAFQRLIHESRIHRADVYYSDMLLAIPSGASRLIKANHKFLFWDMTINHPTCFVRKEMYDVAKYDISYRIAGDYDFFSYCKANGSAFHKIDGVLAYMGLTGASSDIDLSIQERTQVHRKYYGFIYSRIRSYLSIVLKFLKNF